MTIHDLIVELQKIPNQNMEIEAVCVSKQDEIKRMNVSDTIDYARESVCTELCRKQRECAQAIENGEDYECVLDLL